jgi:hypothetical protein
MPRAKSFAAILMQSGWKSPVASWGHPEHSICLAKQTMKELCAISHAGRAGVGTPRARQRAPGAASPSRRRFLPPLGRMFHSPRNLNARNVIRRFRLVASFAVSAAHRLRCRRKKLFRNSCRGPLRSSRWLHQFLPGSPHKFRRRVALGWLLRRLAPHGRRSNPHLQRSPPRPQFRRSAVLSRRPSALP